jgi:hypothetical protein
MNKKAGMRLNPGEAGWFYLGLNSNSRLGGCHRFRGSSFVFAPGGPTTALFFCHPSWGTSTTASTTASQSFQALNRFFEIFAFLFQFVQDFGYVH